MPPASAATRAPALLALVAAPEPGFLGLDPGRRGALLDEAARHGLLAALAGRLPPGDRALALRFQRLAAGARVGDARIREALEEALAALGAAGVVPCALKGPALADRLYAEPALRPASDVDLLLPEAALADAVAALEARGFRRADALVDAYQRRHGHHVHLDRPPGPAVELHFRPQSGLGTRLPAGELLARARPHRTARGTPVRVLAPEDELIVLAVHASQHLLERAGWLLDLLLLLRRTPALDWAAVEARARAWRCRCPLAYALGAAQVAGASVPESLLAPLSPGRRALADRIAAAALARPPDRTMHLLRAAFDLSLRDRPWRAIPGFFLHHAWWFVRRRARSLTRPHPRDPASG